MIKKVGKTKIVRTFVALDIASEVRHYIMDIQRELRLIREAKVAWAQPNGVHLTLKFLGGVSDDRLGEIAGALERAISGFSPVTIATNGHSAFPNLNRPRVLFIDLVSNPELNRLQKSIDASLSELGFELEDRPFKPHLTVGRVKFYPPDCNLGEAFSDMKPTNFSWTVEEVNLMSSVLLPAAARYSVIASLKLNG